MTDSSVITFLVPGQRDGAVRGAALGGEALPRRGSMDGVLKDFVRVAAQRSDAAVVRVQAVVDEDIVVLHIANGPKLVLHPEHARLLIAAQAAESAELARGASAQAAPGEIWVPAQLRWPELATGGPARGATRSWLGGVLLSALEVITAPFKDKLADTAASAIVKAIDNQVAEGVYRLRPDALPKLKGSPLFGAGDLPSGAQVLVLVHGTFVETTSTFGKLWVEHPDCVRDLFHRYKGGVLALDHRTVGASPIENALTLACALPDAARMHLVTHSRGGLVGEVLARVCARPELTDDELSPFTKSADDVELKALRKLCEVVKVKRLKLERLVRVACPSRGTLLASKRLDAYISVFKWVLELTGVPIAPEIVRMLAAVATRRADVHVMPGLAALIPDSPLVQWLNGATESIAGELRVIAGDIEGDSVVSWLKTLLADSFYWQDNDLVVQTRSMYGGTPRDDGASFVLDAGGKVSHFNYFSNARTVRAVVDGLTQDAPQEFRTIGPLSWAGEDASGLRAGVAPMSPEQQAQRPAVFVLPGILGSNLKVDGKRVWLSRRIAGGLQRLAYTGIADSVAPDGLVASSYDALCDFLSESHEVFTFAYDWRRPIEEEARRLADAIEAVLAAREASHQPVRIIAHSMGGLLARTLWLERPGVFRRLLAHPASHVVMLGTPNAGSWTPMQVLTGDDTFGNLLSAIGAPFHEPAARTLMAELPGFLQLQAPLTAAGRDLSRSEYWRTLEERDLSALRAKSLWHCLQIQQNAQRWGIPSQSALDAAIALRQRLDRQCDHDLPEFASRMCLVVGHAQFTPDGYEFAADGSGMSYLNTPNNGDGRVTLESALLPGVNTWTVNCDHGALARERSAFEAYLELLTRGETQRLPRLAARQRGAPPPHEARVPGRPSRTRSLGSAPAQSPSSLLTPTSPLIEPEAKPTPVLRVSVVNGNLLFVAPPLMLGHYRSFALTGTEQQIDRLIGRTMQESLRAGRYPDAPGSHQVFANRARDPDNPLALPRPASVIVVGLGEEGSLRATELALTVCQGVIAWSQRVLESGDGAPTTIELAATLIGSGGTGISAGASARAIAKGVCDANRQLLSCNWPSVEHLQLIELYLDRASEAWEALNAQAAAAPGQLIVTPHVRVGTGPLRRALDADYRGANYDLISVSQQKDADGEPTLNYTVDTRRARTELRGQRTQSQLVKHLIAGDLSVGDLSQRSRTLFQLLVPVELEPMLSGESDMVLQLDPDTAALPWELLDTPAERDSPGREPWALRCRLLRKLRVPRFRQQVMDASADDAVLVIGEPRSDYPPLPNARAEAQAVANLLRGAGGIAPKRVNDLVDGQADATQIADALLARSYRIVHIAGHGAPGKSGGVVLSDNCFLGAREIENMRTVPQLVFVNCCYLAAPDPNSLFQPYDRATFAASVAESLIEIGVRCVVAAAWAVDDNAARVFALEFYRALLQGEPFIEAVARARQAARALGGNTWAAYHCYGDPQWTYRPSVGAQSGAAPSLKDEFANVASADALALALETITTQSRFWRPASSDEQPAQRDTQREIQRERLNYLRARVAPEWQKVGRVAEAFGAAYAEIGDDASALAWYGSALTAPDGSASLRASEQLANLRARSAWARVSAATKRGDAAELNEVLGAERRELKAALRTLYGIVRLQPNPERHSLCGSAYKRLASLEALAKRPGAELTAIRRMAEHYGEAERLARESGDADVFYPAANRMAAQTILTLASGQAAALDASATAFVRQSLEAKQAGNPDFWSAVGLIELRTYEALSARTLAALLPRLRREYEELHSRVPSTLLWRSVNDQASFVLPRVRAANDTGETAAAEQLLKLLAQFAGAIQVPAAE